LQTTDWFGAIQRCFQWSERVEQRPMKKREELLREKEAAVAANATAASATEANATAAAA